MERKLATIQKIKEIIEHPNADQLEIAIIKGWQVIVKKGEFKQGDGCVYVEIDSILPEKECFEFLRERKFRVKTIKLRKVISMGICFPLSVLEDYFNCKDEFLEMMEEDMDITDLMEVEKYEIPLPACLQGAKGRRPSYIPKTDEERIQNIQRL